MPTYRPNTDAIVSLDNASAVLTDISDYVSTCSVDGTAQIGMFYVFGETGAQAAEGKRDTKASLGVRPATDTTGASASLDGWYFSVGKMGQRTLRIDTPDSATGSTRIEGETFLSAWQPISQDAAGDGSPSTQTASLQFVGVPTRSVL